jgi:hypothetical protein
MSEKRPTSSEPAPSKLEEEDSEAEEANGILELFEQDEDAPLARDGEPE